jgi:hypothetical protein
MSGSFLIEESLSVADPLADWRWKIGGGATIVALSRSGDAFVAQADGKVWWLDTGAGELEQVAASRTEFAELLTDPANASRLLLTPVVEEFVRLHGPFPSGKCLSFTQLPVLGGSYSIENRWLAPAVEHFGVTGDMHRQIRDVPDGAKVQIRVVE